MTSREPAEGDPDELQQDVRAGAFGDVATRAGRRAVSVFVVLGRRIGARPALALTLAVGIGVAVLMSFLVARVYDAVSEREGVAGLDRPILQAATGLRSPGVDAVAAAVAVLFGPVGMPAMAIIALVVLSMRRRSWTPAILIAAGGLGSLLMTVAGKDIIGRNRPPLSAAIPPFEYSSSFPSGHTLNATVVAGAVGYLVWIRRHAIAARVTALMVPVVIAIAVGLTRVLLGAHWFTDVLAGWLLGAGWLALVVTAHRLYLTSRQHGAPVRPPSRTGTSRTPRVRPAAPATRRSVLLRGRSVAPILRSRLTEAVRRSIRKVRNHSTSGGSTHGHRRRRHHDGSRDER